MTMTLTRKGLQELNENARRLLTPEQDEAILGRFGTEPWPHEWTGQDIACQIDIYLSYGVFEKPVTVHDRQRPLPDGVF